MGTAGIRRRTFFFFFFENYLFGLVWLTRVQQMSSNHNNVQSEAKARFTGVVAFKNKAAAMSVRFSACILFSSDAHGSWAWW